MDALKSKYQILETLSGGQSIIYKARDKVLDRLVAIKTPNESVMSDPHKFEKFIEEGRKMARLKDQNVLRVLHFVEQNEIDDKCYLITEWMDQTLEQALQNADLDTHTAASILTRILKGLHALHNAGIVHRDLKPSNIYLSNDGSDVRIADLGIASDVGADETLTATPKYIAPEIYQTGGEVDRRSDLYSLGMIAYEMFLGRERFEQAFSEIFNTESDKTRNARWLNWHLDANRSVPALMELHPGIPEKYSQIVARMMLKDPADRYASADEILRELGEIQPSQPAAFKPLPIPVRGKTDSKLTFLQKLLKPRGLAIMSALLLALIIAIIFPYSSGDKGLADEAFATAMAAKEKAATAGAETPPVITHFEQGVESGTQGAEFYNQRDYDLSANSFNEAIGLFEQAEVAAWSRRIETAKTDAEAKRALAQKANAGEPDPVEAYQSAQSIFTEAGTAHDKKQYIDAESGYQKAAEGYISAIEQALFRRLEQSKAAADAARNAISAKYLPLLEKYSANYIDANQTHTRASQSEQQKQYPAAIEAYQKATVGYKAAQLDGPALFAWKRMLEKRAAVLEAGVTADNPEFIRAEELRRQGLSAHEKSELKPAEKLFDDATAAYQLAQVYAEKLAAEKLAAEKLAAEKLAAENAQGKATLGSTEAEVDAAMDLCRQYTQGCKREWYATENLREVELSPFEIDRTEVSNAQFSEFVQASGYITDAEHSGASRHWLHGISVQVNGYNWKNPLGADSSYLDLWDYPVVHVSQADARAYCDWKNQRLPSEDEWEYAARGRAHRIFPWGDEWKPGNVVWNSRKMGPVDQPEQGANPQGKINLSGNVWEWTTTREGNRIVLKGGSWSETNPANLRAAVRRIEDPGTTHSDDGFRCVRDVNSWPER